MKDKLMLPENTFSNKTFIVTGGGSGLGKSISESLLFLNANVVIIGRNEEKLKNTSLELASKTQNNNIKYVAGDVRKHEDVLNFIDFTIKSFESINGVINNAAGNFITPTENLSFNAFDTVVDIVLKGTYNMSLATGKYWITNKISGVFLNIVTTYAESGSSFVVPSATAKAGVVSLTKSLASEWGKYGIRSNAIAPGPFPTDGAWSRLFPKEIADLYTPENKIPLRRFGKHEELCNLATYLLSDYSAYVNGAVMQIDGGEYNFGAGEFNFLNQISSETWKQIEETIRKTKTK